MFLRNIPPEFAGRKKNPQESCQERFLGPKNKFLKTGITNLGLGQARGVPYPRGVSDGKEACAAAGAESAVGLPTPG